MRPYSKIGLGVASVAEIDQINIHYATLLAMSRAFDRLVGRFVSDSASQRFDAHVFVDGKFCPNLPYRTQAVIGGDRTDASIGLASIAAKFYRDWLMGRLDRRYPWYDWKKNKGYPTKQHLEHLNQHGPNQHFRFSYGPLFSWKEKAS